MVDSKHQWKAWIYLAPAVVLLAIFTVWPIINTVRMAFLADYKPLEAAGGASFAFGLANFKKAFAFNAFLTCLKNTILLCVLTVPISTVLALLIAVALNSIKPFQKFLQTIFFLPYVTNSIAIGMVFAAMFNIIGNTTSLYRTEYAIYARAKTEQASLFELSERDDNNYSFVGYVDDVYYYMDMTTQKDIDKCDVVTEYSSRRYSGSSKAISDSNIFFSKNANGTYKLVAKTGEGVKYLNKGKETAMSSLQLTSVEADAAEIYADPVYNADGEEIGYTLWFMQDPLKGGDPVKQYFSVEHISTIASVGIVNNLIEKLGGKRVNWINAGSSYAANITVMVIYIVWNALPFKILILMGGLQSINKQYYDAAKIDGTSRRRILTRITIPLLSPMLAYVIITGFIGGFKEYTSIVGIFGDLMGPVGAQGKLQTMVGFIYQSLSENNYGLASASALILFGIIFVVTMINLQVSKKRVHY